MVISHGGQGTLQCALAAGNPIAGVALQVEQQTNLDNGRNAGAAVRIQKQFWRVRNVRSAVMTVLREPSYVANARALAGTLNVMDSAQVAAELTCKYFGNIRQES